MVDTYKNILVLQSTVQKNQKKHLLKQSQQQNEIKQNYTSCM